ncbi:hypothetical protein RSAG8_03295, partial [Rhizoctonia solani AG-8 WAC10335]
MFQLLTVSHFRFSISLFCFLPHNLLERRQLPQTEINLFVLSSPTIPNPSFVLPFSISLFWLFGLIVRNFV